MLKKIRCVLVLTLMIYAFFVGRGSQSEAKDLTDVLVRGFSFNASGFDTSAAARAAAPGFSAGIAEAVRQVPVASIAPSFIYRLNPAVDTFERLTGVPGPLFSERALTLGKGQFDFSVGYSFVDFQTLNGTDLDNVRSPALLVALFDQETVPVAQPPPGVKLQPGEELLTAPISLSLLRSRIDLKAHIIVPTLRYGITNNWEVSLSVPILHTFLKVRNELVHIVDVDSTSTHFLFTNNRSLGFFDLRGNEVSPEFVPFVTSQRTPERLRKAVGSATGVGDITLRTKYHVWRSELGGAALGLNLQLPTGQVRNLHGTDETHFMTFLYVSQVLWGRFEPRLNVGVDFNTDDVDRSSFLYAVGGTLLIGTKLGLVVDFVGRSEFERFPARIPPSGFYDTGVVLTKAADSCSTVQPCFVEGIVPPFPFFPEKIKRNYIADFAFGLRYTLGTSGSVFFGGIVPMNEDGLRADFIPSGGIEYTF